MGKGKDPASDTIAYWVNKFDKEDAWKKLVHAKRGGRGCGKVTL